MATRYLFKVEYGVERFCSFFVNLLEHSDYSFVNLTNDIRANVRALQITTPATIRIRFRDEDGDYINLPYGDTEMFKEMFKSGHPVKDRDYTKICIKVSELDSPVQISQSGLCGASDAKRPKIKVEPRDVEPIFIEDEDDGKVGKAVQLTKISSQPMRAVWKNQQTPRSLDSNSCDVADINDEKVHLAPSQPPTETMSVMKNPSPLQRYVEKLEGNVNDQRRKVTLMKDDLRIIEEKLTQAKSAQLGEGTVCGNCHLRLGHTSRNCSIEKCTDVFGCGVEKFHARQVNRTKLSQGIKKEETTLQRLEQELENRRSAVTSLAKAPASKIEERLSSENGSDYVVGCMRNWSLLRTHVHLIEDYCKRYFHGKVPPKQNLSDILRLAEMDRKQQIGMSQPKRKGRRCHENPTKDVLERYGVKFPGCSASASTSQSSSTMSCASELLRRCEPTTIDEEEAQLELALQASACQRQICNDTAVSEEPECSSESKNPSQVSLNTSNENDAADVLMSLLNTNTQD